MPCALINHGVAKMPASPPRVSSPTVESGSSITMRALPVYRDTAHELLARASNHLAAPCTASSRFFGSRWRTFPRNPWLRWHVRSTPKIRFSIVFRGPARACWRGRGHGGAHQLGPDPTRCLMPSRSSFMVAFHAVGSPSKPLPIDRVKSSRPRAVSVEFLSVSRVVVRRIEGILQNKRNQLRPPYSSNRDRPAHGANGYKVLNPRGNRSCAIVPLMISVGGLLTSLGCS